MPINAKEQRLPDLPDSAFSAETLATLFNFRQLIELQKKPKTSDILIKRLERMEIEREKVRVGEYRAFCNFFRTHFKYTISEEQVSDFVLSGLTLEAIGQLILEEVKRKDSESLTDLDQAKLKQQTLEHENHMRIEEEKLAIEGATRQQAIRLLPFEQQLAAWTEEDMIRPSRNAYVVVPENVFAFVTSANTREQRIAMLTWFIEVAHADFIHEDMLRREVFKILGEQDVTFLATYVETLKKQ